VRTTACDALYAPSEHVCNYSMLHSMLYKIRYNNEVTTVLPQALDAE